MVTVKSDVFEKWKSSNRQTLLDKLGKRVLRQVGLKIGKVLGWIVVVTLVATYYVHLIVGGHGGVTPTFSGLSGRSLVLVGLILSVS